MSILNLFKSALTTAPLALVLSAVPALALDDSDKAHVEKIVRAYLLDNPEIMFEMQKAYEAKQKAEQVALQTKTLRERSDELFNSEHHVEIGNKDAKFTIVEFFDYNCPFCQRAMNDMEKVLAANSDVKFVIKEWPVVSQSSVAAHNVSVAFQKMHPEKYGEYHKQLLSMKGQKGEEQAIELAVALGADKEKLRAKLSDPQVISSLAQADSLANDLGITGTPSYVIGDQVVFGAVGVDEITARLEALRKK